ncbi:RNA polymerase sigma-70 factor [uncultured Kriegella sp.]|uniref:RNA polymerase sigma factor n=1 Tax=uncultured Kriegella sp. TaxID=1798910 RepID=UPI0030D94A31|tara:strand:+ start:158344 stop:158928 length:585 start_codon:yes stop_codon:yes gene_type:complete
MKNSLTDTELLRRLNLDDISAFEMIFKRYSKDMFAYAMNIFRNRELCEDIIQNIFVDFWANRKKTKITYLKPYFYQAVKFQIYKYLRDKKISAVDIVPVDIVDFSSNVSEKMECEELEKTINDQLAKLPPRCQQIFVLSRYENKTNKEISTELGISIQTVKNQISKALNFLRQNLSSEQAIFYYLLLSSSVFEL